MNDANTNIQICHGQNCIDYGGKAMATALTKLAIPFEKVACQSLCTYAPVVKIEGRLKMRMTVGAIQSLTCSDIKSE